MRLILFAILLGFPLLEAVVLVRLSETLGWWVLAWMILAAVAGMWPSWVGSSARLASM